MMPEWGSLKHAYGSADDLPELLDGFEPDPDADIWEDLWSCLCHQGTVYSASFPVLPYLLAAAAKWQPGERLQPLNLAAAIVSSRDVQGSRSALIGPYEPVVRELHALAVDTLDAGAFSGSEYVELLQDVLAFGGDQLWGDQLDRLNDGEFQGNCPHCGVDLLLAVGEYGFFCTAEEWVGKSKAPREQISPVAASALPEVGKWLHDKAQASADELLANAIRHLFGTSVCTVCREPFQVTVAIECFFAQTARSRAGQ